jgi:hypothetical protein
MAKQWRGDIPQRGEPLLAGRAKREIWTVHFGVSSCIAN